MWQELKTGLESLKEIKSLLGLIPEALAWINNYFYNLIPLSPLLRFRASVSAVLFGLIAVGLTASKINDKVGASDLRMWLRRIVAAWALGGFIVLASYIYLIGVFEQYSYNRGLSILFDFAQIALFAFIFVCWSVAFTALVRLFL